MYSIFDSYRFLGIGLGILTNSYIEVQQKSLEKFHERFPDNGIILKKTEEHNFFIPNKKDENGSIKIFMKRTPRGNRKI